MDLVEQYIGRVTVEPVYNDLHRLVDQLTPHQARLLHALALEFVRDQPAEQPEGSRPDPAALDAWLAGLDRVADVPFMEDGREQPPMPPDGTRLP